MRRGLWTVCLAVALGLGPAGCGGDEEKSQGITPPPPPPPPPPPEYDPPVVAGDFSFYGVPQGLSETIHDVSADEGGNVYVAAGDAVFAKGAADVRFERFDAASAGFTRNCYDPAEIKNAAPPGEKTMCPVVSVAGAAAGKAVIGFQGVGTDYDYDAPWALDSGGADLVSFDRSAMTMRLDRHVFIASPPGVICEHWRVGSNNSVCDENWIDSTWVSGRKKMRQVRHILVNHDARRALSYGDVYFGATHGTIAVRVANPDARGWLDYTKGDPRWAETIGVWEHEHPALTDDRGRFLTGESTALALDPISNVPWFSNEIRTARLAGYGFMRRPSWNGWWGEMDPVRPFLAFWGDAANANHWDNVSGMSFCDDGTLWVASAGHGLKRVGTDGSWTQVDLPSSTGNVASAVACDPSDGSVWVGFGWGGFGRWKGGWKAESFVSDAMPAFAWNPVRNIQIDRWSSPRIVYMAHEATPKFGPGGVTVYSGP
jgi:hypothetical protein